MKANNYTESIAADCTIQVGRTKRYILPKNVHNEMSIKKYNEQPKLTQTSVKKKIISNN